ncbi:MAG: glycosyltransferase family 2 protein [Roseburia sp.]|nr:glycosyltransferase family 2 protein [Roseburia sp.]
MITVIIPAYNCEKFIEQTLESAVSQTVEMDLEILVVDDCSTDCTGEVVKQFISCHQAKLQEQAGSDRQGGTFYNREVSYIKNPKNLGVAETRNTGIRKAEGEYVAFLDGDDWWDSEKLKKQLSLILGKKGVLVYTGRELMQSSGESAGKVISVPETADYKSLLCTNCIPCSSVMMRTEVAREFYMCHDELHEDYILWLRVLKKYGKAYGINEPLLKSRLSEGGKSRNKLKSAKMHYGVYKFMGIPAWKAVWLFLCYAWNGVRKYR